MVISRSSLCRGRSNAHARAVGLSSDRFDFGLCECQVAVALSGHSKGFDKPDLLGSFEAELHKLKSSMPDYRSSHIVPLSRPFLHLFISSLETQKNERPVVLGFVLELGHATLRSSERSALGYSLFLRTPFVNNGEERLRKSL